MIALEYPEITHVVERYGSPFYLFDRERFRANVERFGLAMEKRYTPFLLGYSYKTNYLPAACRVVKELGGYAEVVSRLEYELALRLGYEHRNIIFNGPLKRAEDLAVAFAGGAIVNLDSLAEVELLRRWVEEHPAGRPAVGLRINVSLVGPDGRSRVQAGLAAGRFGFAGEDLRRAVAQLSEMGIPVVSLHGHASSSDRSVENFRTICHTLCAVRERHALDDLRYFNVGGGFFGEVPRELIGRDVPSFDDYARAIADVLLDDPWIREHRPVLVAEPGVSVVADCMSFYMRIHSLKSVAGKRFVTVDGSVFNVKPTMHPYNMLFRHIRAGQGEEAGVSCDVVGSTCMEKDVILRDVSLQAPRPGDYIEIKGCGAYTIVMTPPFINLAPAIVAPDGDGGFELLREAQGVEHFLGCYEVEGGGA